MACSNRVHRCTAEWKLRRVTLGRETPSAPCDWIRQKPVSDWDRSFVEDWLTISGLQPMSVHIRQPRDSLEDGSTWLVTSIDYVTNRPRCAANKLREP